MSDALRAKLLAQRAEQKQNLQLEKEKHKEAKMAARELVALGLQFNEILTGANLSVSYLEAVFHSIGLPQSCRPSGSVEKVPGPSESASVEASTSITFGTPRWLELEDNYKFSVESEVESDSDTYSDSGRESGAAEDALSSASSDGIDLDGDISASIQRGVEGRKKANADFYQAVDATASTGPVAARDVGVNGLCEDYSTSPNLSEESDTASTRAEEGDLVVNLDTSAEHSPAQYELFDEYDVGGDSPRAPKEFCASSVPSASSDMITQKTQEADDRLRPRDATDTDTCMMISPILEEVEHGAAREIDPSIQVIECHTEHRGSAPDLQSQANARAQQLKAEIGRMQLDLERQKQAIGAQHSRIDKRASQLRVIASKRASLLTTKSKLKVAERSANIARLERLLQNEKESQLAAARESLAIDKECLELEKQALLLRGEVETASMTMRAVGPEILKPVEKYELSSTLFPSAIESPLARFPSFRICPRLAPAEMFHEKFNAPFVLDLQNRVLCSVEFGGARCTDAMCANVHLKEFTVPKTTILQYMATRHLDAPGYRAHLIKELRSRFQGNIRCDDVAAAVAEIAHQFGIQALEVEQKQDADQAEGKI